MQEDLYSVGYEMLLHPWFAYGSAYSPFVNASTGCATLLLAAAIII
jgi:hypothetical protein